MSYDETKELPRLPDRGFYYHYKHDPAGSVNNYAYEVIGVGFHTEDDCRPEDQFMVQYRPLYNALVYRIGKGRINDARPLGMFMEKVIKNGMTMDRFTKITDQNVIAELTKIRDQMYL